VTGAIIIADDHRNVFKFSAPFTDMLYSHYCHHKPLSPGDELRWQKHTVPTKSVLHYKLVHETKFSLLLPQHISASPE